MSPDEGTTATRPPNTGGHSVTFTVQNVGIEGDAYAIDCVGSGNVTCTSWSHTSVSLNPEGSVVVTAYFSVGPVGSGMLTLTVTSTVWNSNAVDDGSYTISIATPSVAVTPDGTTTPQRQGGTGGHSETFTIQNGPVPDTYTLTCAGLDGVTCAGDPPSVNLGASASQPVTVFYSVGQAGTGTLRLTASGAY